MKSVHHLSFAEHLLSSLPSGETLDTLVSHLLPEAWTVGAPLDPEVERRLMKLPGLRGQRIVAATTPSKKAISAFMRSPNPSVRKALAYNPALKQPQALAMASDASERKDGATVLALLAGRADFGTLLSAHPTLIELVSAKDTHAGGDLLARRLLHSDETEAKKMLSCRELTERFGNAPVSKARELARSSLRGNSATLRLLNDTYSPRYGAMSVDAQPAGSLAGAPSSEVERVLASATGSLRASLIGQLSSNPQSSDSEIAALFALPIPDFGLNRCSEQAQRVLAGLCAQQLTSLGAYQLFEQMLPDWTGSLQDLATVVSP